MTPIRKVNLAAAFQSFSDHWSPKVAGQINDFHIKLAKVEGEFVWHHHEHEDEMFLVVAGELTIKLRDQDDLLLGEGEFAIIPRGLEHKPIAESECHILLLEPATTRNTGHVDDARTVETLDDL